MLLQNGDDFDLLLPFLVGFEEAETLLDEITVEGDICRVVLRKTTPFRSNVEVVYVLNTNRGSSNILMTLPEEVRDMIFEMCLRDHLYASTKKFFTGARCARAVVLRRWLPQSDNIKVLGTTSFLQSMKKITFTGHFIGAGYNMGLLLVAMKERGDLHPMLEPHIRHCSWPTSTIAQDYHFCRQGPLSQQLLNGFDQINKTLGRGKRLSARQWQQARSELASALEQTSTVTPIPCPARRSSAVLCTPVGQQLDGIAQLERLTLAQLEKNGPFPRRWYLQYDAEERCIRYRTRHDERVYPYHLLSAQLVEAYAQTLLQPDPVREPYNGALHPPHSYQAGDWTWHEQSEGYAAAIRDAFNCINKQDYAFSGEITARVASIRNDPLMSDHPQEFYHPQDRPTLHRNSKALDSEVGAAMLARSLGYSLAIMEAEDFSPLQLLNPKAGTPKVQARWSPGDLASYLLHYISGNFLAPGSP
ncbi:hypothetical protein KC347_g3808 [Hortaea werneckii]|nr:hypothetical protein KC347_g3808 [Hortaea werneckii]